MNISNDRYAFINAIVSCIGFFDDLSFLTGERISPTLYITRENTVYCARLERTHEIIYFVDRVISVYGEDTNEKSNECIERLYTEVQRQLGFEKENKDLIKISNKIRKLFPATVLRCELGG